MCCDFLNQMPANKVEQLLISQNHPSLRSYKHHLTILSAQLSIWQHSFKYAKSQLRRLIQTFLPSDPRSTVYGAWLELISTLATPHVSSTPASAPRNDDTPTKARPSVDSRKQDIYAALSALTALRDSAKENDHEEICLLADVIRLRVLFDRDSGQNLAEEDGESELSKCLIACEQGLGLAFEAEAVPGAKPSITTLTTADPLSQSKETPPPTPLIASLRLQTLMLGVLHHTQKGIANTAGARLAKLHALCDAGALDPIVPPSSGSDSSFFDPRDAEGRVEVILPGKPGKGKGKTAVKAERMWVSVPHPRCMLLLSYLGMSYTYYLHSRLMMIVLFCHQ